MTDGQRREQLFERTRRVAEIVGTGLGALIIYFIAPLDGRLRGVVAVVVVVVAAGILLPLSIRRARQVLVSDSPLLLAMQSVFTVLTVFLVSFSSAYYVLGTGGDDQVDGIETKVDALYFTVTVLTTVGFGDITAVGQGARALVTLNMILNLVLVGITVRLMSWALTQRRGDLAPKFRGTPPADDAGS